MKDYDRDTFWNIDSLVPKTKKKNIRPIEKKRLVDYYVDEETDTNRADLSIGRIEGSNVIKRPTLDYAPRHDLIKRVVVEHIPDKVDFHSNFARAAHLYFDTVGGECEYVPFYSYMPRYPQLNDKQKKYYFYFREKVREGEYIKCDKSYLDLLAYEIINLPDIMSPNEGIEQLAGLWGAYRDRFAQIDESFATWVMDYSLLNQVECPIDKLSAFIYKILPKLPFKEFFLSDMRLDNDESVDALLYCLSDYAWQTGRYASEENKEIYRKHLIGAMRRVFSYLNEKKMLFGGCEVKRLERRAFVGATVSSVVKCNINIEYTPFNIGEDIRRIITQSVKYCENKLRMLMGVKSRLAIKGLDEVYKGIIDEYFRLLVERAKVLKERASRPEYEELYEAENNVISLDDAENIEKDSWITTARLVELEEDEELSTVEIPPLTAQTPLESVNVDEIQPTADAVLNGDTDIYVDFIKASLDSDYPRMKRIIDSSGKLIDTIVEEINDMFVSMIGDVIFDTNDDGYSIIEDYKEEIEDWLRKM